MILKNIYSASIPVLKKNIHLHHTLPENSNGQMVHPLGHQWGGGEGELGSCRSMVWKPELRRGRMGIVLNNCYVLSVLVASLMSSLHQLKADNSRLEERLATLTTRKNQLLQVNARLATPMSCTSTSSTATLVSNKQSTLNTPGGVTASLQGSLSTETKTTVSSGGPRGSVSAGSDGTPKIDVSPSTSAGKVLLSPSVKPASSVAGERRIPNGDVKSGKAKELQSKRPETNLNTVQNVSSSPSAFQKQPIKVNSLLVQSPKTTLPQQTLAAQLDKDKQQKQTPLNALAQVIVPAQPASKTTQQQPQLQQQPLQARFQPQHKIILPQPSPTTQGFSSPSFSSQPQQTASQQHVLLQLIQQQDDGHRLVGQNSAFSHDKAQLGSQPVQAQKLLPSSVPNQPFSAHSLSLSYPGAFLTFSDPMGLSGPRVDMMKATHLAPLQMVSLDSNQTGPKERSQVRVSDVSFWIRTNINNAFLLLQCSELNRGHSTF